MIREVHSCHVYMYVEQLINDIFETNILTHFHSNTVYVTSTLTNVCIFNFLLFNSSFIFLAIFYELSQ